MSSRKTPFLTNHSSSLWPRRTVWRADGRHLGACLVMQANVCVAQTIDRSLWLWWLAPPPIGQFGLDRCDIFGTPAAAAWRLQGSLSSANHRANCQSYLYLDCTSSKPSSHSKATWSHVICHTNGIHTIVSDYSNTFCGADVASHSVLAVSDGLENEHAKKHL